MTPDPFGFPRPVLTREQGFYLGQALHTLQDSYCASHVVREGYGNYGRIEHFQEYEAQDVSKHKRDDHLNGDDRVRVAYGHAVDVSTEFLELFFGEAPEREVLRWLTKGSGAPLKLAPDARYGGASADYAKRK